MSEKNKKMNEIVKDPYSITGIEQNHRAQWYTVRY